MSTKNNVQLMKDYDKILNVKTERPINEGAKIAAAKMIDNQMSIKHQLSQHQINEASTVATSLPGSSNGGNHWDSMMVKMLRRSIPEMIAFDVAGVQPLESSSGAIFAMSSFYGAQDAYLTNRPGWSGDGTVPTGIFAGDYLATYNTQPTAPSDKTLAAIASGLSTSAGEVLGSGANPSWNSLDLQIKRYTVEAKSRKLKTEYTQEIAQDAKAIHGLDFEREVIDILSNEITREINTEVLHKMYYMAVLGGGRDAATGKATGIYDVVQSSSGRWANERFKGLLYQIEMESNAIAKATRRGKGNFIVTTANVASALSMTGLLQNINTGVNQLSVVDETGSLFCGTINGKKVYVDPYAQEDFVLVGYKGSSQMDAGLFYCPYQPLQLIQVTDPQAFQPALGFQTRYGVAANPLCQPLENSTDVEVTSYYRTNGYYRIFRVDNLAAA